MDASELSPYNKREMVQVDKDTIRQILYRGEEVLGFDHKEHGFEIVHVPEAFRDITLINAFLDATNNRFLTPEMQFECTIFHECVHYVMFKNGLLFMAQQPTASLYDRLVDETVAELATSELYGFRVVGSYVDKALEAYEQPDAAQLARSQDLGDKHFQQSLNGLRMAKMHREIESKYLATRDFKSIEGDVLQFHTSLEGFGMATHHMIRSLAIDNAIYLRDSGVSPKDLVEWLKDGTRIGWDSFGLYFYDVVIGMQYQ